MKALFRRSRLSLRLIISVGIAALLVVYLRRERPYRNPDLKRFAEAKRAQAMRFASERKIQAPAEVWRFFDAAVAGRRKEVTNRYDHLCALTFDELARQGGQDGPQPSKWQRFGWRVDDALHQAGIGGTNNVSALRTEIWTTIDETYHAISEFGKWDEYWLRRFGDCIFRSVPTNSIYFGGTDAGRYIISVLSSSQMDGEPFFTLSQTYLADSGYLSYLETIYGRDIRLPSTKDAQTAFTDYLNEAQRILEKNVGRSLPDQREEEFTEVPAVIHIDATLAKLIFDPNPNREFFVEESYPIEWMFPHLSPHGFILKLNRQPSEISEDTILVNDELWSRFTNECIGDVAARDTSVAALCEYGQQIVSGRRESIKRGSETYLRNAAARQSFSKLRGSIAGVYAWRKRHAASPEIRSRMAKECDFAYKQAFALCPGSAEIGSRYAAWLLHEKRSVDAGLIVRIAMKANPTDPELNKLAKTVGLAL